FELAAATGMLTVSVVQTLFQRVRRFHRCLESMASLHHRDRAWWNVCYDEYFLRHRRDRRVDAKQQMVRFFDQLRTCCRSRLDGHSWLVVREMGPQHRGFRHAPGLRRPDCFAIRRSHARSAEAISPATTRRAYDI